MRDANGNVAGTLGAVLDQAIVIGGLKFFTTIHVVPNAPFSLILGTPFCAIASIEISYRPSSEMVIKITDPNTEKSVLIPGSAKPRRAVARQLAGDNPVMLIVDEDIPPLMDMSDDEDDIPEELEEPKAPDRSIPIEVYALDNHDRFARPPPHQLFLDETTDDNRH
ncbi:hypothetical protein AURDEDRAFT_177474 [Auricularia subglabra TFB-10046 SS5]|uniref:Uncharacterized protein n=1 Tax=Auricularia subglabra (strain TFB-10046 / SS5) TaxID=717982 RepID=J0CT46_AURST|nr:hypothetical protein AURDEDRAFT_177474 [Auricularia subglabra TFB-10046 SS5]